MTSRVVLITGANSGVGYAATTVLAKASENFHVIMAGRSMEKIEKALAEIEASGIKGSLSALQLDVTDETSIQNAAESVEQQHGRLDALVNNAAVGNRDSNIKTRMQVSFATNVIGAAMVAEAFRPLLLKSRNPYSIYISSGMGSLEIAASPEFKLPNEDAYRAGKAALNMIAVLEARDYGPEGLKVFAMCPGFVVSNLRGTDEESRTGGGQAGDPLVSGQTLLNILEGKRDAEVGKFVHKDGVYPW